MHIRSYIELLYISSTAGVDYTQVSQTVKFVPGQSTATVNIPIKDDNNVAEPNITFTVTIISSNENVIILSNSTVTIVDNDHGEFSTIDIMSIICIAYNIYICR